MRLPIFGAENADTTHRRTSFLPNEKSPSRHNLALSDRPFSLPVILTGCLAVALCVPGLFPPLTLTLQALTYLWCLLALKSSKWCILTLSLSYLYPSIWVLPFWKIAHFSFFPGPSWRWKTAPVRYSSSQASKTFSKKQHQPHLLSVYCALELG